MHVSTSGQKDRDDNASSNNIFEAEDQFLQVTLELINEVIVEMNTLVDRAEGTYQDAKNYMVGNRGELDPSEQFQNELFLQKVDQQSAQAYYARTRLMKLLDSPYFAKVVFIASNEEEELAAYIGRFSFTYQSKTRISDWRSPIASLFYDFDLGLAEYESPLGVITGQLVGKRQFKIEHGVMKYAIDSASSIRDEILQQELSRTSDKKMKSIISSIQGEQNKIIRDEKRGTLIIQGVAGSGKTSIALHRIAFLLYRQKNHLSSKSVAILSPNKVFSDFISNVLPELGEEPIVEQCFQDIFERLLKGSVELEKARSSVDDIDLAWRDRAYFKGSFDFMEQILAYLKEAPERVFKARSVTFGRSVIKGDWLETRFRAYTNTPIDERIESLVSDIILELSSKIMSLGYKGMPTRGHIRAELRKMLSAKNALLLYKQFYRDNNIKKMFVMPDKERIEWEDACPLILFQGVYARQEEYVGIEHLVIDEMQDLTPIQHVTIERLFSCDKTILGDYYQMVDSNNCMNLASMQKIYSDARVVELKKSYRSTSEITKLAKKVKNIPALESVARHGDMPCFIKCANTFEVLAKVKELLSDFEKSEHKTLGILHQSEILAERYYELLSHDYSLHLLSADSTVFEQGVSICSVKMAKGLEFDEVIILDVDEAQYFREDDRNLLYVAITRAMHKLSILYRNQPSAFLVD